MKEKPKLGSLDVSEAQSVARKKLAEAEAPSPHPSAPSPVVVTEHGERLFKQGKKPNQIILQDGKTVTIEPWSSPPKTSAPESEVPEKEEDHHG